MTAAKKKDVKPQPVQPPVAVHDRDPVRPAAAQPEPEPVEVDE